LWSAIDTVLVPNFSDCRESAPVNPDDPNAHPTRTFAAAGGDPPADHTRPFPADASATASFAVSAPPPLDGPVPHWPPGLTRYQPLHALGGGGMGVVYLCHDRQLDRQVAVKLPGRGRATPQDRIDFVLREARSAARLHHPNVCPVFDADVCDGVPYLTMAYIDGPTLAAELKRCGPCPPKQAAELVRTVAEAMQYAHDQGVVHRDLKPGNILLTAEREPVVTDFGLAVRTDQDSVVQGAVCGTPHYMSPEQAAGDAAKVGERSDVFALGVILFEMLTGHPPFAYDTGCRPPDGTERDLLAREVLDKVQREAIPGVRDRRPDLPPDLARIVATATARDPADRFPDMAAFAAALTGFLRTTEPKSGRGWRVFRRPDPRTTVAITVLGSVAIVGVYILMSPLIRQMQRITEPLAAELELDKRVKDLTREGEELAAAGQFDRAEAKYTEALKLNPQAAIPRRLRGAVREQQERHSEALSDFDALVEQVPNKPEYRRDRAAVLMKMTRHRDALVDLNAVIRTRTDLTGSHTLRGEAYYELKEYDNARADLIKALELDKENANAWYLRAQVERELGTWEAIPCGLEAWRHQNKLDERFRKKLWEARPPSPQPPQPPPPEGK
jgi:hypothetical protein